MITKGIEMIALIKSIMLNNKKDSPSCPIADAVQSEEANTDEIAEDEWVTPDLDRTFDDCMESELLLTEQSIISASLEQLRRDNEQLRRERQETQNVLTQILDHITKQDETNNSRIDTIAECQKFTADFANKILEKYALYPAVETVDYLTNRLQELNDKLRRNDGEDNNGLLSEIADLVLIAKDKCEYLSIESVIPKILDSFDATIHEICQTTITNNEDEHKCIEKCLVAGLRYKNQILRPVKVSVYRYQPQT